MKYERFEDLPVWNKAIELAERVYGLTGEEAFRGCYSLRDQLERAALSVSNNIAEGFERGTTSELLAFLYIARGSAGEVRSVLCLLERRPAFQELLPAIRPLKAIAESCSRQIRAWADSLQNSDIKGQRHLNNRTRQEHEQQQQERQQFLERLRATVETARLKREAERASAARGGISDLRSQISDKSGEEEESQI